jgi:hypothetical protein
VAPKQAAPVTFRGADVEREIEARIVGSGPGRRRAHVAARDLRRLYKLEELSRREPYPFSMAEALTIASVATHFSDRARDFTEFPTAVAEECRRRGTPAWSGVLANGIDVDGMMARLEALPPCRLVALLDILEQAWHHESGMEFIEANLGIPDDVTPMGMSEPA